MLRRWAIRVSVLFAGFFVVFSWLRITSRKKEVLIQKPPPVSENPVDESARERRVNLGRIIRSTVAIIGALATLAFAYLAVAVSAHWFPWEIKVPSTVVNLELPQSHASRLLAVNNLTNFLTENY